MLHKEHILNSKRRFRPVPIIVHLMTLAVCLALCSVCAAQVTSNTLRSRISNATLHASSAISVQTTQALDVRYASASAGINPRHLSLDIYAPSNVTSAPVMIYVHGGGWQRGDKAAVAIKPQFFNEHGWIFVSTNYRLVPEGRHPQNARDVASAIAWVHNNIKTHGGDPRNIFLMGHSAGAHLVALVGTDHRHLEKAGKYLSIIRGVVALDTQAYDVQQTIRRSRSDVYPAAFSADPGIQADASPINHVVSGKNIPPFIIAYSSGLSVLPDSRQRRRAAQSFADALTSAGIFAQILDASDRNHREINARLGDPVDSKVTGKVWEFLQRNSQ